MGFENEELTNFIKSPAWFLAGDLLQPLFAMGKNKAKLKAARARYEQEVYNYQKSVLSVFKEIRQFFVFKTQITSQADLWKKIGLSHSYPSIRFTQFLLGLPHVRTPF